VTLSCHETTTALGAYVVGALDPRERADVEAHLAGCASCRAELTSLAALPGLMSRLSLDEVVAGPPPVDDAMLERLLAAAARERRVGRRRRVAAVLAAAAVIVGTVFGGLAVWHTVSAPTRATVVASAGPVHMRAVLTASSSGTAVGLWLSGVPSDEHCRLVAVSDTGQRETAGSWAASYSGVAVIQGTTAIPRRHLRELVIETYDGQTLVAAEVPAA
jgi:anti-sigma factor RsiW